VRAALAGDDKSVYNNDTSQYQLQRRYLYNGSALIAETDTSGTLLRTYTWGLDLAGSLHATGGVGALLQITNISGTTATDYYPTYDANGNIAALVSSSGALAAAYEYSPAGEPLRSESFDAAVADNPFKFSSKFTDSETGLVYYGHRYYSPSLGRFINRDPIAEAGGANLYGFCRNDGVNGVDYIGNWSLGDLLDPFSGQNPLNPLSQRNLKTFFMLPHYANPLYWAAPKFYRKAAPAVDGAIVGAVVGFYAGPEAGGAAGGFVSGFEGSYLNGGSVSDSLKTGAVGAAIGFAVGGIIHAATPATSPSSNVDWKSVVYQSENSSSRVASLEGGGEALQSFQHLRKDFQAD
jgi:RHS repeat-associated protein